MPKFIVKDAQGNLQVVGAEGFVPEGAICEAPQEAEFDAGDLIDLETFRDSDGFERIKAVVNQIRKAAKDQVIQQAEVESKKRRDAKASRDGSLKALWEKANAGGSNWKSADAVEAVRLMVLDRFSDLD